MPFATRRHPVVPLVCTALAAASLAFTMPERGSARAGECLSGTLADEFTADRMGLVREWIIQIPSLAPGRTLENVVAGDGLVVVGTSDGLVHAIQAAAQDASGAGTPLPGTLLWSRSVGRAGGRFEQAGIGTDLVVVCQDKETYGLARDTGLQRWHETDTSLADAGAAVIGKWVYAPNGSSITRFAVNPLQRPAAVATDTSPSARSSAAAKKDTGAKKVEESLLPADIDSGGVVAYQPVRMHDLTGYLRAKEWEAAKAANSPNSSPAQFGLPDETEARRRIRSYEQQGPGVLWCTTDGLLVTRQPTDVDWQRLEFALENPPAGPPTVRDGSIFATTTNGDLARIDLPRKMTKASQLQLTWHAVLPGPAESGAFVSADTVVVSLGDLGIAAYSAASGSLLWQSCVSGAIVSVGGDRVWLFDRVGRLSSLHIADGLRRETLCLGPFTMPLVNLRDERLLLASPSGMIVSLVPRRSVKTTPPAAIEVPPASPQDAGTDAAEEPMPPTEPMEEPAPEMTGTDEST